MALCSGAVSVVVAAMFTLAFQYLHISSLFSMEDRRDALAGDLIPRAGRVEVEECGTWRGKAVW